MRLQLLDKDDDIVGCNGEEEWVSFEDCKKDIEEAFLSGDMNNEYLPYRFADTDEEDPVVYQIVKKISMVFETTPLRVVPYKHRRQT